MPEKNRKGCGIMKKFFNTQLQAILEWIYRMIGRTAGEDQPKIVLKSFRNGIGMKVSQKQGDQPTSDKYEVASLGENSEIVVNSMEPHKDFAPGNKIYQKAYKILSASLGSFIIFAVLMAKVNEGSLIHRLFPIFCTAMLLREVIAVLVIRNSRDTSAMNPIFRRVLAANAVRNAFYKKKAVPTVEEAQAESHFSPECNLLNKNYLLTVLAIMKALNAIGLGIIVWALIAVVLYKLELNGKFSFWQACMYSKPDQVDYELAIHSLSAALNATSAIDEVDIEEG